MWPSPFFLTQLSLATLFGRTKYSYGVMLSNGVTLSPQIELSPSPLSLDGHVAALVRSHLNGSIPFKGTIEHFRLYATPIARGRESSGNGQGNVQSVLSRLGMSVFVFFFTEAISNRKLGACFLYEVLGAKQHS